MLGPFDPSSGGSRLDLPTPRQRPDGRPGAGRVGAEIGWLAAATGDLAVLGDELLRQVAAALPADGAVMYELDDDGRRLVAVAGAGRQPERRTLTAERAPAIFRALTLGRPAAIERRQGRAPARRGTARTGSWTTLCAVAQGRERPYGVLVAHAEPGQTFREADLDYLQGIANVVAAVAARQDVERQLRACEERMEELLDQLSAGVALRGSRGAPPAAASR